MVEEKPHSTFTRSGNDLVCTAKIPLVDALTGSASSTKLITMLDGRKKHVSIPTGIVKPGMESRIIGEGMPIRKDGQTRSKGDLIVKWDVEFPGKLTASQKENLRMVLAP